MRLLNIETKIAKICEYPNDFNKKNNITHPIIYFIKIRHQLLKLCNPLQMLKKIKNIFFCFQVISSVFPNYLFRIVNENNGTFTCSKSFLIPVF